MPYPRYLYFCLFVFTQSKALVLGMPRTNSVYFVLFAYGPRHANTFRGTYADSEDPDQGLRTPLQESLDFIVCISGDQRHGCDLAHAQDDVNPHILCMLEHTCSLDAARMIYGKYINPCHAE